MSMSSIKLALAVGAVAAGTCSAERLPGADQGMYMGKISGDNWPGTTPFRVAYGRGWAIGGDSPADSAGEFRVPASARAVVAYIDSNHNGRLDRFAEPSGDCQMTGHTWSCPIRSQKLTIHRIITARDQTRNDQTTLTWEDFDLRGARIRDSHLCIADRCTSLERSPSPPGSSHESQTLSICGSDGFPPQNAELRGLGQTSPVRIAHPAQLDVLIHGELLAQHERALRLHIQSPSPDRILIWGGSVDVTTGEVRTVYWSSEDTDIRISEIPDGIEARISSSDVRRCERAPDCEVIVQLLKYWSLPGGPVVSATEYRSTVALRGPP